ncbi:MAG: YccF domain-containing protein [Eubacteriales bacterium]
MRLLGNIIWFLLGGLWMGLAWSILGVLFCITIIGIPFGKQCFKMAGLSFFPSGKKVIWNVAKHPVANVIWGMLIGWEMSIGYLAFGIVNCIIIIGIPRGIQSFKLMKLALFPFGAKVIR